MSRSMALGYRTRECSSPAASAAFVADTGVDTDADSNVKKHPPI
jgi:hypothetical protein